MRTFLVLLCVLGIYVSLYTQSPAPSHASNLQLLQTRFAVVGGEDFFVIDLDDVTTPDSVDFHFIFHFKTRMLWYISYHDSADWYLWNTSDTITHKVKRRSK